MRIAIYARQSIYSDQSESIENQIKLCTKYCENKFENYSIIEYYDQGYSGKNMERPYLQKLLKDIESKKIDIIVVYKNDRFCRNTRDFLNILHLLKQNKVKLISLTENFNIDDPTGEMFATFLSAFAQFERGCISERVRDNMYESAKNGSWQGGPAPFGYKLNRIYKNNKRYCYLVEDKEKSHIVKLFFSKYVQLKSLTKLQQYAKENALTGARGNIFDLTSIGKILRNPCYVKSSPEVIEYLQNKNMCVIGNPDYIHGFVTYAKNSSTAQPLAIISKHQGIIDSNVWLEVQNLLKDNSKKFPRQKTGKKALLSGILKCKHCGSNMNISYKNTNNKQKKLSYYICSLKKRNGKSACICSNLNSDKIDNLIINYIDNIDINTLLELFENNNLFYDIVSLELEELQFIQKSIKNKEKNLNKLTNILSITDDENISSSILSKMKTISSEISTLNIKLNKLNTNLYNVDNITTENIIYYIYNFDKFFRKQPLESKINLINSIIDRIEWDSTTKNINIIFK